MKDLGNYEAQKELLQALQSNNDLVELVKDGFHNLVADSDADFPRVVYSELQNRYTGYADNDEIKAEVHFQISIFTNSDTIRYQNDILKLIDSTMKQLNYKKYDSIDLYEDDTKLYHKGLRYEKNFY